MLQKTRLYMIKKTNNFQEYKSESRWNHILACEGNGKSEEEKKGENLDIVAVSGGLPPYDDKLGLCFPANFLFSGELSVTPICF
ncbi:hypothetical protein TSUD_206720 [Trifolium subterraneum]|uniref:Uncharacterized protein n=1 Tax=Trifolium subterraneum TaxID=3900 RepID=A0A2Z6N0B6_TRISU|nr:hypothetical protein TSUD_206720 [Trifolium subterraneum]